MEGQTSLPDVTPGVLVAPKNYTFDLGLPVRYTAVQLKAKCDDCLHRILDWSRERDDLGAPPLSHTATIRRHTSKGEQLLCTGHVALRKEKEARPSA